MSKQSRAEALAWYDLMEGIRRARGDSELGLTYDDAQRLGEVARQAYFRALPTVIASRCPICGEPLELQFDPYGFDGFWWQKRNLGPATPPSGCHHFRSLTGAVALAGSFESGQDEAYLGPDVPYVVPAALELPTMSVVISSVEMDRGHIAYPMAYFSTEPPPPESMPHPWRRTSLSFLLPDGRPAWTIKNDPWDFDLSPWIQRQKVRWIPPGSTELADAAEECPYLDLPGERRPQLVYDGQLRLLGLPDPTVDADPFGD